MGRSLHPSNAAPCGQNTAHRVAARCTNFALYKQMCARVAEAQAHSSVACYEMSVIATTATWPVAVVELCSASGAHAVVLAQELHLPDDLIGLHSACSRPLQSPTGSTSCCCVLQPVRAGGTGASSRWASTRRLVSGTSDD